MKTRKKRQDSTKSQVSQKQKPSRAEILKKAFTDQPFSKSIKSCSLEYSEWDKQKRSGFPSIITTRIFTPGWLFLCGCEYGHPVFCSSFKITHHAKANSGQILQESSFNGFTSRKQSDKRPAAQNGFLLGEALLALMIAMITGFLLLTALSALSKSLSLTVPEEMETVYEEGS